MSITSSGLNSDKRCTISPTSLRARLSNQQATAQHKHRCLRGPHYTNPITESPDYSTTRFTYGNPKTCRESVAIIATYCLPFLPEYVIGFALPWPGSCATHSSFPFFESNA